MERYTLNEQKKNKTDLVIALRSGNYKQGKKALRKDNFFCCLGVACDISGLGEWNNGLYLDKDAYLPLEVMNYYGFVDQTGSFENPDGINFRISLSSLNDMKTTFEEIANIIESEPKGMFE